MTAKEIEDYYREWKKKRVKQREKQLKTAPTDEQRARGRALHEASKQKAADCETDGAWTEED